MKLSALPDTIEPIQLAERRISLHGFLALTKLTRLDGLLSNKQGHTEVQLDFGKDDEGWFYIKGTLKAELSLVCQRCLKPMMQDMNLTISLSPVKNELAAKNLPSYYEPLLMTEEHSSLVDIIEDELLLQLPLVAKHLPENCEIKLPNSAKTSNNSKPNPFKILETLKLE